MPLTEEQLCEIEARLKAATPGPIRALLDSHRELERDRDFHVEACAAHQRHIDELQAQVSALQAENERMAKLASYHERYRRQLCETR